MANKNVEQSINIQVTSIHVSSTDFIMEILGKLAHWCTILWVTIEKKRKMAHTHAQTEALKLSIRGKNQIKEYWPKIL